MSSATSKISIRSNRLGGDGGRVLVSFDYSISLSFFTFQGYGINGLWTSSGLFFLSFLSFSFALQIEQRFGDCTAKISFPIFVTVTFVDDEQLS